jgi:hypothetical protein
VSPQYFNTVGMRILTGRDFTDRDTANAQPVALVNETFIRRYALRGNPVGTTMRTVAEPGIPETAYTIIGVVSDARYSVLREPVPPMTFVPLAQRPDLMPWPGVVIRSAAPPSVVMASVKRVVAAVRPNMASAFTVFDTQVRESLFRERLLAWLAGALGGLATLLAMIGVYGVVSYLVVRRCHEIAIRLALGAGRLRVIRLVFAETLAVLTIGLILGVGLSLTLGSAVSNLVFGLSPHDPVAILTAIGALAFVVFLAVWVPATRASRMDAMATLRAD